MDGTMVRRVAGTTLVQVGLITLAHEITERIEMEAALDGIITIDQEGKIIEFNPAAERLLGYPRSAAVGQLIADLIIPPSMRERHRRGLARIGISNALFKRVAYALMIRRGLRG